MSTSDDRLTVRIAADAAPFMVGLAKARHSLIETRRFDLADIADLFQVELHVLTSDLPAGYWERALQRRVARRAVRYRVRRWLRRVVR